MGWNPVKDVTKSVKKRVKRAAGDVKTAVTNPKGYAKDRLLQPVKDLGEGKYFGAGSSVSNMFDPLKALDPKDINAEFMDSLFGGDLLGLGDSGMGPLYSGKKPVRPGFDSLIDPATGLLKQPYQISGNIDTRAMDALRTEGLRTGPSAWRTMTEQQEADKLAARQAQALNTAKNQMAMTRGLSTGAAERMASAGQIGGLRERQDLARQMAIADEAKRMDTLRSLPGQELNLAGFTRGTSESNVGKALDEITAKREADLDKWKKEMEVWGAERVASATPSGGKK